MIVQAETATVYRATTRRRYLTRASAYLASAREKVRQKYPCRCWNERDTGATCDSCEHLDGRYERIVLKLAGIYMIRDERAVVSRPVEETKP